MSPTPRTAAATFPEAITWDPVVSASVAAALEIELAAAQAEIARFKSDPPPLRPDEVIYTFESGPYFDENAALSQLLAAGVLFSNCRSYAFNPGEPATDGPTTVLFVNCNDIFAWGCADAEDLPSDQIEALYRLVLAHPFWGAAVWCCHRRQSQPQAAVAKAMKEAGTWDEAMEGLAGNAYDRHVRERRAERDAKGEKWCAACGKWTDHQSGTCPTIAH